MKLCKGVAVLKRGIGGVSGLAVVAAALWGCGAPITVRPLAPEELTRLNAVGNFPHRVYRLEPGDAIQIRYTYHPELKQENEVVRPDGKITANMVGTLTVAGMTTADLEKTLVERTSDQLRDPEVVVSIARFGEKQVYVGGEVGKPGPVAYRKGLTPLQAIIAAGGFRPTGRLDSVILVRNVGSDQGFMSRTLNLVEVLASGENEHVQLAPHDVLFVPATPIAEAGLWVQQHIRDLLPIPIRTPVP